MIKTMTDTLRENFKYEWAEGTSTEVLSFFAPIEKRKEDNKTNNMNINNTYKTHQLIITLFGKRIEFKPKLDKQCLIKRTITIPGTEKELKLDFTGKTSYYEIENENEDKIRYQIKFFNFTPNSPYTVTRVWSGEKADEKYNKLIEKEKYTFKKNSTSTKVLNQQMIAVDKNNLKIDYIPNIKVYKDSKPSSLLNRVVFKGQLSKVRNNTVPIKLG